MQIVVEINKGLLVGFYSSEPGIEVYLVDWDNIKEGHCDCIGAEEIAVEPLDAMSAETRQMVDAAK